jgi:outer membrane biosynthesis protein TonB
VLLGSGAVLFFVGFILLKRGDTPMQREHQIQQVTMIQEEPPPPPPPEEPEPEEIKEVIEPVETAKVQEDVTSVSEDPSPAEPSSEAAGLDRPADIGSDSFHLAAGGGGGLFGKGEGGGGSWNAFVATHIRKALQRDPRTRSASGYLEVLLSIDMQGRFERAELQSSTGDKTLDEAIREVLSQLPPLSRSRPPSVKPLVVTGINLRSVQK